MVIKEKKTIIIILAAGKGTRMCSKYPKVLHLLGGKTILQHVIDLAKSIFPEKIIIVHRFNKSFIKNNYQDKSLIWIKQNQPLGTGDAVRQATKTLKNENNHILILYGDVPLTTTETIKKLKIAKKKSSISLLTLKINKPNGYGRILRKNKKVIRIIEEKDANSNQLKIKEINSGIFIVEEKKLKKWLNQLKNNNCQKEYYITDIINYAYLDGATINTTQPTKKYEVRGINNKLELSMLEKTYQKIISNKLLISGLTLLNPSSFYLKGSLIHGHDVEIHTNVTLEGNIKLGDNVKIGIGCIINNSTIGHNTQIHPYTIIENVIIKENCTIGPFAHLKSNTIINKNSYIGNFVETKNIIMGTNSKAKHLSYLGDANIGSQVNIGAGAITCNYNGIDKFKTIIKDNVMIGANTELIAPISIAQGTTIAAGTTVIENVNQSCLVYNKKKQHYKKK